MTLIQEGIDKGLIKFDDEQKYITYIYQNKRRNFGNPEERVQAESFLKLVLIYGYKPERIEQRGGPRNLNSAVSGFPA